MSLATVRRLTDREAGSRLDGRNFHVNRVNNATEYEDAQLRGIARGQPRTGFRICIMQQWDRTETVGGVTRPANVGNAEGTLASALGAGHFGIRGLERTIVARPLAVDHFLLAHELGHLLLGAGHADRQEQGNLMLDTSNRVYNRLSDEQRRRAREAALHIPGNRH